MKVHLEATYTISQNTELDLPGDKTWADVKDYYVKWGHLVLVFNDGTTAEIDGGDADIDSIDFKRPLSYIIFAVNEDGETDYETILADH